MSEHIHPIFDQLVKQEERERFLNQRASVFWLTGLSGSGKSTIAQSVERILHHEGYFAQVIDGDNIRSGLCNNLGFSIEDRKENIRRIAEVAKLYLNSGVITMCSFISPTREIRAMAKEIIGADKFHEIYIATTIEVCEDRDVKGLYAKARTGEIKGFTGIDSPYEPPLSPQLIVKTDQRTIAASVGQVGTYIIQQIQLGQKS